MNSSHPAKHAGEAVAEAIGEEGVDTVYSVPGSHIHPIYDGLSRIEGLKFVTVKQEPNASLMADAYGRFTGRPGVCVVTAGPGCINSMAGVAQAYGAASPMVHISGAVPLNAHYESFHGVDEPDFVHQMFRPITKWTARVERIEDIPETMARAFHIARSGRPGPVHVELPRLSDYSEFILQQEPALLPEYQRLETLVVEPVDDDVDRFARRLLAAKSPVIAAGKGVIRTTALSELAQLADKLQAPVVFAQDTIGVIPGDNPLSAGHFGGSHPHPICAMALNEADFVFCIGTRMATAEMAALQNFIGDKPFIIAGFDDRADVRYQGDGQKVVDPKLFLTALLQRLGSERGQGNKLLLSRIAGMKATIADSLASQNAPHRSETPIYPGVVMEAMNAVLDDDAIVASDVGNCQMWARLHRRITTPWSFMQSGVWNAMSFALPTALVAGMEMPDRDVVALAGDGAFLMTSGDLPTAAEYGANILIVIMNNGAFGQTFMQQQNIYGHTFGTTFTSPDFATMAHSCGAVGIRVSDPTQVTDALRDGLKATKDRPALVEMMVADSPYPSLRN
ncbi:thiamine pyrophosphate-binding protein [Pseudomonadota bacterium]